MIKTAIPFLRYRFMSIGLSLILITLGFVMTAVHGGFNISVDFQSGLSIRAEIQGDNLQTQTLRDALKDFGSARVQPVGIGTNEFNIQVKSQKGDTRGETMAPRVQAALEEAVGAGNVKILSSDFVDTRFSSDLVSQSLMLTSIAIFLILVYVWFRFKFSYAVASIVATLHDVLFMISVIGAFQIEVGTATIAAILTIIGYSLNDTIVVFDRIRENAEIMRDASDEQVINSSITTTLSRTIITSMTTVFAVVAIFVFTSGAVQNFALNLIVGIVIGTYSSIFIASPIMLILERRVAQRKKDIESKKFGTPAAAPAKKEAAHTEAVEQKEETQGKDVKTSAPASRPRPVQSRTKKRKK